jgi:hypothetical protein
VGGTRGCVLGVLGSGSRIEEEKERRKEEEKERRD